MSPRQYAAMVIDAKPAFQLFIAMPTGRLAVLEAQPNSTIAEVRAALTHFGLPASTDASLDYKLHHRGKLLHRPTLTLKDVGVGCNSTLTASMNDCTPCQRQCPPSDPATLRPCKLLLCVHEYDPHGADSDKLAAVAAPQPAAVLFKHLLEFVPEVSLPQIHRIVQEYTYLRPEEQVLRAEGHAGVLDSSESLQEAIYNAATGAAASTHTATCSARPPPKPPATSRGILSSPPAQSSTNAATDPPADHGETVVLRLSLQKFSVPPPVQPQRSHTVAVHIGDKGTVHVSVTPHMCVSDVVAAAWRACAAESAAHGEEATGLASRESDRYALVYEGRQLPQHFTLTDLAVDCGAVFRLVPQLVSRLSGAARAGCNYHAPFDVFVRMTAVCSGPPVRLAVSAHLTVDHVLWLLERSHDALRGAGLSLALEHKGKRMREALPLVEYCVGANAALSLVLLRPPGELAPAGRAEASPPRGRCSKCTDAIST